MLLSFRVKVQGVMGGVDRAGKESSLVELNRAPERVLYDGAKIHSADHTEASDRIKGGQEGNLKGDLSQFGW